MRCFGRTAAEVMCLLRASYEEVCDVALPRFLVMLTLVTLLR